MVLIQAPCLTPEWNRTSHAQTVFYTEQRCIPLHGQCPDPLHEDMTRSFSVVSDCHILDFVCSCCRFESGPGRADGGGAPSAGVFARGAEPLPCLIGQSQQPANKPMHVTTTGGAHRL